MQYYLHSRVCTGRQVAGLKVSQVTRGRGKDVNVVQNLQLAVVHMDRLVDAQSCVQVLVIWYFGGIYFPLCRIGGRCSQSHRRFRLSSFKVVSVRQLKQIVVVVVVVVFAGELIFVLDH